MYEYMNTRGIMHDKSPAIQSVPCLHIYTRFGRILVSVSRFPKLSEGIRI